MYSGSSPSHSEVTYSGGKKFEAEFFGIEALAERTNDAPERLDFFNSRLQIKQEKYRVNPNDSPFVKMLFDAIVENIPAEHLNKYAFGFFRAVTMENSSLDYWHGVDLLICLGGIYAKVDLVLTDGKKAEKKLALERSGKVTKGTFFISRSDFIEGLEHLSKVGKEIGKYLVSESDRIMRKKKFNHKPTEVKVAGRSSTRRKAKAQYFNIPERKRKNLRRPSQVEIMNTWG